MKVAEIDVYVDVADEAEAKAVIESAAGTHYDALTFQRGVVEHGHPTAVSHYQLDDKGEPRKDDQGKAILNTLRTDKGAVVTDRQGRPQFPPPAPAKLRVRLNYR